MNHPQVSEEEILERLDGMLARMREEVRKVFYGQDALLDSVVIGLLCRGHLLLEGVPGLGKTLLVRTLARVLDLNFSRIQFTPDLMPTDITGTDIIEEEADTGRRKMTFLPGPIFCNLLLADEINRTPPKTQSALLEAMQEHQVTAGTQRYPLDPPFFVLATQNPIEQEGTYPLPEAQLDRFMFNLRLDYPSEADEVEIALRTTVDDVEEPEVVLSHGDIIAAQALVRRMPVDRETASLAARLVRATRPADPSCPENIRRWITWGAGTRAVQYLILAGKARALLAGRGNTSRADLRAMAPDVLRHRIVRSFSAEAENVSTDAILVRLLDKLVPI